MSEANKKNRLFPSEYKTTNRINPVIFRAATKGFLYVIAKAITRSNLFIISTMDCFTPFAMTGILTFATPPYR
jgi:hypothetical protein